MGSPGLPGRDGLPGVPGPTGEKGIDGKHGTDGRDGIDGLGFDDLSVTYDGERTFTLTFEKGDRVKTFPFSMPIILDRGVYAAGKTYVKGDGVTWGGSFWIAQDDTSAKPGEPGAPSRAWRLAVKKGADGKEGKPGEKGLDGKDGRNGKDWGRPA